jgi:hypothetical protein
MIDRFLNQFRFTSHANGPCPSGKAGLLIVLLLVFSVRSFASIQVVTANGTYRVGSTTRVCTDPDSGLLVGYTLYSGFSWTTNDNVTHTFPVLTVDNSSDGYGPDGGVLCGPDTVRTGSGSSSDGSFIINVYDWYHAQIYDRNGNLVFSD